MRLTLFKGARACAETTSRVVTYFATCRRTNGCRRTIRCGHTGYALSQRARKRIEEVFGWKTVGGLRKLRHRGGARVDWQFLFTAYNLVRMRNLAAEPV
jgi:IS5 family transposase